MTSYIGYWPLRLAIFKTIRSAPNANSASLCRASMQTRHNSRHRIIFGARWSLGFEFVLNSHRNQRSESWNDLIHRKPCLHVQTFSPQSVSITTGFSTQSFSENRKAKFQLSITHESCRGVVTMPRIAHESRSNLTITQNCTP